MADEVVKTKKSEKTEKKEYIFAVGRRKEAVARVRLYEFPRPDLSWGTVEIKKGDMLVNGKSIAQYFSGVVMRHIYTEPFRITNTQNKFTVTARVAGGGPAGQLDAFVHGVSRALSAYDPKELRSMLKKKGFLTRDSRIRERRKVGTGGKARRKKQSPKR